MIFQNRDVQDRSEELVILPCVCLSVCQLEGSLLWTQGHEVTLNHWILTDSLAIFLQGITPPLRVTVNVYRVHQQGLQHTPEKSLLNITQPLKAFNRHVTQAQHNLSVPNEQQVQLWLHSKWMRIILQDEQRQFEPTPR